MIRFRTAVEFSLGCFLALGAAVMFANTRYCFFNSASCGMVERILGLFALALAIPMFLAAWLHRRGRNLEGNLAYVPVIMLILFLLGQARSWW